MKIYLLVENAHCNPSEPYVVIEVFTNKKKAMALAQYPNNWVQTWTPAK